ncbi:MAG: hypothetical protein M3P12_01545, partial [Gemmatimonadota bacterium]|nr:hypothetical protein [Gemmatimonadota bacterium]
ADAAEPLVRRVVAIQDFLRDRGRAAIDFVTSRADCMKRSTTGLKVRFFSVTISTGHGRTDKSTGNSFSALRRATERGHPVMNWPLARKWLMRGEETVTRAVAV